MTNFALRSIRRLAAVALLASTASVIAAPERGSDVAVPFYRTQDVVAGLYRHWAPPRAAAFSGTAGKLRAALAAYCGGAPGGPQAGIADIRDAWKLAVSDWERLSAVPFGPLIERRSVRAIDFTPARPALIGRAITQTPRDAAGMERIGGPAKGFSALEWLLWEQPIASGSQACTYAVEVAADILREADALQAAFAGTNVAEWDTEKTSDAFTEFVNQWTGSIERLRWQQIERPVREAKSRSRSAGRFPRHASGVTSRAWAVHWDALRNLAASTQREAPKPGAAVIPMELYLRGRGQTALADRWQDAVGKASTAMHGLAPEKRDRLLPAARRLASLKRMAEDELAPALDVSIGFSGADGD